ncbi:hypothetical protein HYZ97_01045 [Candidatus Pacearchaeota archaeon]|nr:hypothetical protein [Candidatus Pacearchaeota archaeon]
MRGISAVILGLLLFSFVSAQEQTTDGFDLNSLLLKVSLTQGEKVSKVLTISRGLGQQVSLDVEQVPGVSVSEQSFVLESQEAKNIMVTFDTRGLGPGVYVGNIKISDNKHIFNLPVIFEIETQDVFYDINLDIPPQYSSVAPGQKLVAQLKLFDLTWGGITQGLGPNTVDVEYTVQDINGKTISSESESLVVDRQTQITKTVSFPEGIQEGNYVFAATASYKSSVGAASYLFTVARPSNSEFLSGSFDWKFFAILIVVVIFFLGIIFFFVYLIRDRDTLILQLKKYNDSEFKRQREFILAQEKVLRKKGVPDHLVKKERDHKIKALEKDHAQRMHAVQRLAKKGDEQEMKRQLEQWKKQGYNTLGLEYKMKSLSTTDMKKLLGEWKQHYGGEEYKKK